MARELSVHDNILLGYEVNAEKFEIVLRTEFRDAGASERTDVIFEGVSSYLFEYDSFRTILFGVEETEVEELLEENWRSFEVGLKVAGWPGYWAGSSKEEAISHLVKNKVRAFSIISSLGMSGWVLAKSFRLQGCP